MVNNGLLFRIIVNHNSNLSCEVFRSSRKIVLRFFSSCNLENLIPSRIVANFNTTIIASEVLL